MENFGVVQLKGRLNPQLCLRSSGISSLLLMWWTNSCKAVSFIPFSLSMTAPSVHAAMRNRQTRNNDGDMFQIVGASRYVLPIERTAPFIRF